MDKVCHPPPPPADPSPMQPFPRRVVAEVTGRRYPRLEVPGSGYPPRPSPTGRTAVLAETPTLTVLDPADGSLVGTLEVASPAEVGAAVDSARKAARDWARTPPAERAARVGAGARAVAAAADALALSTTREMGKPLADARGGVDAGVGTLEQYAQLGPLHRGRSLQGAWSATDLMVPQPRGVV